MLKKTFPSVYLYFCPMMAPVPPCSCSSVSAPFLCYDLNTPLPLLPCSCSLPLLRSLCSPVPAPLPLLLLPCPCSRPQVLPYPCFCSLALLQAPSAPLPLLPQDSGCDDTAQPRPSLHTPYYTRHYTLHTEHCCILHTTH